MKKKGGCGCYDSKKERKRVEKLAAGFERKTGKKTELVKIMQGEKVCWDFRVINEG
jgi:hypothetical protein